MPVSRKRKKSKATARRREQAGSGRSLGQVFPGKLARDRRVKLARRPANALVTDLTAWAQQQPQADVEDELCARLGPLLGPLAERSVEDFVDPDHFAVALVHAACDAVGRALRTGKDWTTGWRILTAVVGILPDPLRRETAPAVAELRRLRGGDGLPPLPDDPALAGQAQWTRDRYGSRFGVIAPFATADGPARWYLWDIDVCTYRPITVHSRYHASAQEALAGWRAGVGEFAAGAAAWQAIDDTWLLEDLLPVPEGVLALGGESAEQFAEYHRCRRLAEALLDLPECRPADPAEPGPFQTAAAFASWREKQPDPPAFEDLAEAAEVLVESWPAEVMSLYHTCSPHRVAHTVLQVRAEFDDDLAERVIALLPDWVTWVAARNGTPAELVERSLPYAAGLTHPALGTAHRHARYLARVVE